MTQEISFTLKADTREAVKSVKDLEKQIAGLENLQRKGQSEGNFLDQDDVKQFRRMSEETERIYRDFYEKLGRIQKEIEKKKSELEQAQKRGASQSTTQSYQRELKELEARKNIYKSQQSYMDSMRSQGQSSTGAINDMNSPGMFGNVLMLSKKLLPMLATTFGAMAVFNFARKGMEQIKVDEAYMSQLGQRVPGYNGDFEKGRLEATQLGLKDGNAYKALDTMQVAQNYSSIAGAKSISELWQASNEVQTSSRVLGLDANELATQFGTLASMGAADYKTISALREGFVGAIKETGMAGRDREFINAVTGLSEQVGRGQMELSTSEFNQLLGLQTILGRTGLKGLQGDEGANVLSQLDSGVKSGDSAIDIMLGWGTKYTGVKGRAELERLKAGGISDPELLKELFSNIDNLYGGDKDQQALWLKDKFGITMEQADALLRNDVMSQLKQGGLSKEEIQKIMEQGKTESAKRQQDWIGSDAQRRAENEAEREDLSKDLGSPLDKAWNWAQEEFFSQPDFLQALEVIGGGLGGGLLLGKALPKVLPKIKGLFGSKIGGGTGGIASKAGTAAKGLGKVGGKLLPGIGTVLTAMTLDDLVTGAGDWVFGHEKGDDKIEGLFSNPFNEPEKWTDTKRGALNNLWDSITPWDTEYEKSQKSKSEAVQTTYEDSSKTESLLNKSKENGEEFEKLLYVEDEELEKRKSVIEAMNTALDKEKRNIDELKNIYGIESSSSVPGEKNSGGGFIEWVATTLGFKNSGSTGNSNFSNVSLSNTSSDFSGSTNAEKAFNFFKSKGFSDTSAAGVVGNLLQESGGNMNPTAYNASSGAYGIAQWRQGRLTGMRNWAAKNGKDPDDVTTQLGWIWEELNGADSTTASILNNKYGGIEGLKKMSTSSAVEAFEASFERSGGDSMANRNKYANEVYEEYSGKSYSNKTPWSDTNPSTYMQASSSSVNMDNSNSVSSSQTINLVVSGGIDGMTPENNNLVAKALASKIKTSSNVQLAYEWKQGIGGLV